MHSKLNSSRCKPVFFFSLALLSSVAACTSTDLKCDGAGCQPLYVAPADNQMALQGEACTASPNTIGFPYKILFIVDVSGSTSVSDRTKNRGPAVQAAIEQYANNPMVSYALMTFDTKPSPIEPNFTRDLNILLPLIPQLNRSLGFTDYGDTLAAARTIIMNDANQLDAVQRARTRYDIQWLSDGVPNPCLSVTDILSDEQSILDLVKTMGLYDIKLSTVYLTGAGDGGGCNGQTPDKIMQPMASEGSGTYQALTGPNLHFKISFDQIIEPFSKQIFYVVNQSRTVKNGQLWADSDMDGVSDADETTAGTDPTRPTSHPGGCSDRINYMDSLNPGVCDNTCSTDANTDNGVLKDTDADELKDCEEVTMGTSRMKADSDGDNFIDTLEMRYGTNPADASTMTIDSDVDGTTDGLEILTGTDPLTAEPDRSLAFSYTPLTSVGDSNMPVGENCFDFMVQNVQMVQTIATTVSKAGDNTICAYIEQRPTNTSSTDTEPTVSRACVTVNYVLNGKTSVKTPASGMVQFKPTDFVPYICGSLPCR